jgi:hypothetical protein
MSEATPAIGNLTEEALHALLKRAIRNSLILGVLVALALTIGSSWRDGAMFLTGALISAASIFEWQRLARIINVRMQGGQGSPSGTGAAVVSVLLRLVVFAAAIYGSLIFLRGSPMALFCGLGLAVATLLWEALRLLKS